MLISAKHITVRLGEKSILHNVDLTVASGQMITVVGPNGAGKSTLLKVLLGLQNPTQGVVERKPHLTIGYMPQSLSIEPVVPLSVERFLKLTPGVRLANVSDLLAELRVDHLLKQPMQFLSGGELQRVLFARALLRKPELLILDEPVQGVDLSGQEELYRLIATVRERYGCGILMVSHDLHFVMAGTDWVVCLNQHVCCAGHPNVISQRQEFLELFDVQDPQQFAVYAHRHDHKHIDGDICT